MTTLYGPEARERIWSLIKDTRVAMLATHTATGLLHARPMMPQIRHPEDKAFDGVLWFFTGADTGKMAEIEANPAALLTFSDPKGHNYVAMNGTVTISRDPAIIEELWSAADKAWFPDGKDDPNLRLLRFEASDAEFWDSPGLVAAGIAFLQALVTGERADPGDHGQADLDIPDFPEARSASRGDGPRSASEPLREKVPASVAPRDPL
ncbi:pyridoxamine 5'-phosphate oxidase family protein [Asticcacaulis sp. DW145]|uniref:pyridoxamine 5'-phosphate oxidase family protein n=1 Tax=Asticcacaulis sp. DW145 TaxID=3095608 RepID=UPI00308CC63F|nr:pyridoxamine 5'-phosphate oxidase family protein [Asticcacaulis sp. DW145]